VLITYLAITVGIAVIISSFLIIIKQYDRAIILRLGKYQKRVGLGVQTRIPFADSVLVLNKSYIHPDNTASDYINIVRG